MMRGKFINFFVNPTPKEWSLFSLRHHKSQSHQFMSVVSSNLVTNSNNLLPHDDPSCDKIFKPSFNMKYGVNTLHTSSSVVEQSERDVVENFVWLKMQEEAKIDVTVEPILSSYYHVSILSQKSLETALANHLSVKLSSVSLPSTTLSDLFVGVFESDKEIMDAMKNDLIAVKERDPACISHVHCFLNFKGFLACQAHRVAHNLWSNGRKVLAVMIQNRVSEVFGVDIHPGAKIGSGILLDHATGIVVGETAIIGNDVSILHGVTLGGTGKAHGDRHPKIGDGVLIGAGTCILGNIKIGDGAKIGAGSVVIMEVPPRTTVVGNPAKLIGGKNNPIKLDKIPSHTMDHISHVSEFYDYVI
ncbi:serine acetyltransferase 1, chloroplastic-like [Trifolium pratense]|uniref:serine acetyltransferase 1, chloroplastic-like n=1 Tax=Trifolium pratense TaxID=57577 RepID=UPI001E69444F|nr:serine acetyltransferase 1, chloroplastic-like [Trifolium pratense]